MPVTANAKIAQLVEHDLAKVGVAGSSPVSRSLMKKGVSDKEIPFFHDRFFMTGSATKDFEGSKSRLRLGRRYCYKLWRKTHRLARGSS